MIRSPISAFRHVRLDDVPARPAVARVEAQNLAAPLPETMPLTRAVASVGTCDLDLHDRLEQHRRHCGMPSVMAIRAAVWKAISEESTVW